MPPKNSPQKPKPESENFTPYSYKLPDDAKWGGFINVRLNDDDKLAFSTWWEENVNVSAQILEELLGAGIKVTLAYDSDNDSWLCSLTGRLVAEFNDRYVTTTRAASMAEVIALACWKHVYVCRGVYHPYVNERKKPQWG